MIIIMNILISLIGFAGIILARNMVWEGTGMGIKSHLVILSLKLIASVIIIGLFLMNTKIYFWPMFILSGMINIIIFHFTEAFLTQRLLLYQRKTNV